MWGSLWLKAVGLASTLLAGMALTLANPQIILKLIDAALGQTEPR